MPRYSETAAREAIAASKSWSEALRRLGLRAAGGNHALLKRWVATWGIPTDHFDPHASQRGRPGPRAARPLSEVLTEHSTYSRGALKRRLFAEGIKARCCELCGQEEEWRGRPMSLILDHVNGVHDDNRLENLRIVCPNCAATFDTHCARNVARAARACPTCHSLFRARSARQKYCSLRCWHASPSFKAVPRRRQVPRPSYEQLMADLRELSWVAVGAKYGVSDNAVRKWIRRYEQEAAAQSSRSAGSEVRRIEVEPRTASVKRQRR